MTDKKADMPAPDGALAPKGVLRDPKPGVKPRRRPGIMSFLRSSFVAVVLAPTLAFGAYSIVASDRYAATSSFVVRSQAGSQGGELLDSISGSVSSGSTKSDSYIIRNFVSSADVVRLLDEEFDFNQLFGRPEIDWLQRMDPAANFADKLEYWQKRVSSTYDHTTGILTLEVQAFSAEDAQMLASRTMEHIRTLVNKLSSEAREQSYSFARDELKASEELLRHAQDRLKEFRATTGITDPSASATRDDQLIRELNKEIIKDKVSLDQLRQTVKVPGPNITNLEVRIASHERLRDELMNSVSGENADTVVTADLMADYERILLEIEIARSRYARMLESMEGARRDADSQQRYLAVFSEPYVADEAEYPRRLLNTLMVFIALSLIYAIAQFVIAMVRDHNK